MVEEINRSHQLYGRRGVTAITAHELEFDQNDLRGVSRPFRICFVHVAREPNRSSAAREPHREHPGHRERMGGES